MELREITIMVANREYKLNVDRTDSETEEIRRLSGNAVNAYIVKLKQIWGDKYDSQDYLAIAALHFSAQNIAMTRQGQPDSDDLRALDALSQRMDRHLNRLPRPSHKGTK